MQYLLTTTLRVCYNAYGLVDQLDRSTDFYSVGCRFESCLSRQSLYFPLLECVYVTHPPPHTLDPPRLLQGRGGVLNHTSLHEPYSIADCTLTTLGRLAASICFTYATHHCFMWSIVCMYARKGMQNKGVGCLNASPIPLPHHLRLEYRYKNKKAPCRA